METILIWLGSGFAFAIGVLSGAILAGLVMRKPSGTDQFNIKSLELLAERNKIGWEQVKSLDRIAEVIELKGESV